MKLIPIDDVRITPYVLLVNKLIEKETGVRLVLVGQSKATCRIALEDVQHAEPPKRGRKAKAEEPVTHPVDDIRPGGENGPAPTHCRPSPPPAPPRPNE